MAAGVIRNSEVMPGVNKKPTPPGVFDAYQGSIPQTGSDYDEIMQGYRNILSGVNSGPGGVGGGGGSSSGGGSGGGIAPTPNAKVGYNPITATTTGAPTNVNFNSTSIPPSILFNNTAAQQQKYAQSGDTTSALAGLKDLADTGGYTEQGKNDIRARGVSPIRSAYATAARTAARSNNLQGGYSPNSGAVAAKLAREQAGLMSEATTSVNAGLAQNIAQNRLSAAPAYASASSAEAQRKADVDRANVNAQMDIDKFNTSGRLETDKFNTTGRMNADQFNASGKLTADSANADAANKVSAANAGILNSTALANANNRADVDKFNAQIMANNNKDATDTTRYNNDLMLAQQKRQDDALKGMTSLYGTTPALANTFGNQALNQQQIIEQQRKNLADEQLRKGTVLTGAYGRG